MLFEILDKFFKKNWENLNLPQVIWNWYFTFWWSQIHHSRTIAGFHEDLCLDCIAWYCMATAMSSITDQHKKPWRTLVWFSRVSHAHSWSLCFFYYYSSWPTNELITETVELEMCLIDTTTISVVVIHLLPVKWKQLINTVLPRFEDCCVDNVGLFISWLAFVSAPTHHVTWRVCTYTSGGPKWVHLHITWPDVCAPTHHVARIECTYTSHDLKWVHLHITWPEVSAPSRHMTWSVFTYTSQDLKWVHLSYASRDLKWVHQHITWPEVSAPTHHVTWSECTYTSHSLEWVHLYITWPEVGASMHHVTWSECTYT
jgi:hypothetical protein